MRRFLFLAAALASVSPAIAREPCPPPKGDLLYPWVITDLMPGDEFAEIYLDIDAKGRPTECRMGANNIPGDNKYFVCRAFMGIKTAPPAPGEKTIQRHYMRFGTAHIRANSRAKKKFFAEHPDERPECYRE